MTQFEEILPTQFKPNHYTLFFHPQPEQNRFIGKTTIEVECLENTNELVLNSIGMTEIKAVAINKKDNSQTEMQYTEDKNTKEKINLKGKPYF